MDSLTSDLTALLSFLPKVESFVAGTPVVIDIPARDITLDTIKVAVSGSVTLQKVA